MRKGEQTRLFCISHFQGWLCYLKFISDCLSVHRVNWRPLSQYTSTRQACYTSHPPDSISWDTHKPDAVTVGLFHWPNTIAFAQFSSFSFHQLRHSHGHMLILWGFFTDPALFLQRNLPMILLLGEYGMLHRGPGILAIVWFGSSPTLPYPSPVSKLDQRVSDTQEDWEREATCWRVTEVGGWARSRIIRAQETFSSIY